MQRAVVCGCGQKMAVSETALGKTGVCVRCGQRIRVTPENLVPVPPRDARQVSIPESAREAHRARSFGPYAGEDAETGEKCARCGRALRGVWDRNKTPDGVKCHICAHQWHPPEQTRNPIPSQTALETAPNEENMARTGSSRFTERQMAQMKRAGDRRSRVREFLTTHGVFLFFIAVSGIIMAAGLLLPVGEYVAEIFTPGDTPSEPLGDSWTYSIIALKCLFSFLETFGWLYLCLFWVNKLPNDMFWKNAIALGVVALILRCIGLIGLNGYLGVVAMAGQFGLLMHLYDLDTGDLFKFIGLGILLTPFAWALEGLFFGVLSAIAL